MLEAINCADRLYSKRCKNPQVAFRGEQTPVDAEQKSDTFEKQGMSTNKKVAISVGSLLGLIAVGYGIKKHIDTRSIKKVTNEAIEALKKGIYKKSANAGDTVQETIINVLGKDSVITPHTYDVSKEFPAIHVYRDCGGYKDGLVTPSGIDVSQNPFTVLLNKATMNVPENGNVPDIKNKVVKLILADPKAFEGRPTNYMITIVSPNHNYTPLQKDVLKLIDHPEKIDVDVFDKICKFMKANDDKGELILENVGKYENLDYDLMLSAIQSMAKGL